MSGKETTIICSLSEKLWMTVEVLTGKPVSAVQMDLRTNRGKVRVAGADVDFKLSRFQDDLFHIKFNKLGIEKNYTVRFHLGQVRAMSLSAPRYRSTVAGEILMEWVGDSLSSRHEEPFFRSEAERRAKKLGLTLEELLNSNPKK